MSKKIVMISFVCSLFATYMLCTLFGDHVTSISSVPARNDEGSLRFMTTHALSMEYEYVIAHFKENLDWLKSVANYTHVYDKGHEATPSFSVHRWEELPNVGREGHTYLYHIINNYDNLANITIFLQGQQKDHIDSHLCYPTPLEFLEKAKQGSPCILIGKCTNWGKIDFVPETPWRIALDGGIMRRTNVTFGEFFQDVFGKAPPAFVEYCWAACFSATRECLRKYPKETYEKMMSYLDDHSNPEEGHYMERLWRYIATC